MPQLNPTTEALNTLREKLREMFHFTHNDLNFGIFRILKIKRDEVNQFIDEKLTTIVDEVLTDVADALYDSQLTQVKEFVNEYGSKRDRDCLENIAENTQQLIDFLQTEGKEELIAPLQTDLDELKAHLAFRVYNHVHSFFEGYYRDGDFGYNDRSTAQYKVDYPGEANYDGTDTLFHWKCRDSYYVKTATGFNSIAFEVEGKQIEYRLEGEASSSIAQNNNRDDFKHYRFGRIDPPKLDDTEQTWRVILHLAETSTPKVEIYREMCAQIFSETDDVDVYLHEPSKNGEEQGKPIFKNLANTYDKVNDGKLQGIKALRLNLTDYANKLASHPDFKELGKNKALRQEALQERPQVIRFHTFDKNLNTFFVGMDSDYFIHKDLDRFLKTEQRRYIQNTILGDLDTLLNNSPENPAFAIATAFRSVTNEVIAFLAAVETFQKRLFLMKKKVISTDYLISVGKILEATKDNPTERETVIFQILENKAQLADWRETFGIDFTEQLPLTKEHYSTLPLDTQYFDDVFVDNILASFPDLEDQINGVLLNSENFQALNLIQEKYRGKIKSIYIDPPYNTGADGFLYRDAFRHSSWLSLMYDRLLLSREIAQDNSSIAISINEEELFNLKLLLDMALGNENYLTTITVKVRHEGRILTGDKDVHEVTEQLLVYRNSDDFTPTKRIVDNTSIDKYCWNVTELIQSKRMLNLEDKEVTLFAPEEFSIKRVEPSEENLHRESIRGTIKKINSSGRFYTNHLDPRSEEYHGYLFKVPDMGDDGLGYRYFCIPSKHENRKNGFYFQGVPVNKPDTKEHPYPNHWEAEEGYWDMVDVVNTVGQEGVVSFPNGKKPLAFVTKYLILAGVEDNKSSICLDYFAGSGTTGHAVLRLNKTDNGNRKFILVEMGDYFESKLKKRIRCAMFSENWKRDKPDAKKKIDGTVGIVKYQRLEQYEDVLNNLTTSPPNYDTKTELPVKYLYRPEEQQIRLMIDMGAPFSNRITYGKDSTEGVVDVLETYCYFKGLSVQRRLRFDLNDRVYRVIRSGTRAVVFRNVTEDMDDTSQLLEILVDERLAGVTQLDVNCDANQQALLENSELRQIRLITTSDFDTGLVWDAVEA
ncbi:MAG: site-specific DNA-methyltransferase [Candidatus Poribacteria bacterium]|nr:site-specific DNA-methyltransferase [Candidatus Poribacteria bacterium]